MFTGRKLVIATKHHKEEVIAPLLEKELGVHCFVATDFDTDALGTFSGEVERKEDPISTVRKKCLWAMEQTGCDLGVASEGSFGAHPSIYFATADDEFVIFIDKKNDIEIIARALSTQTNYASKEIKNEKELLEFAKQAQFPSHALILRPSKTGVLHIKKGITNQAALIHHFDTLQHVYATVYVETDMRAMHNPMRMQVIAEATQNLVDKLKSICPQCQTPGFAVTDVKEGLPCGLCGVPTKSVLSHHYSCKKCNYQEEKKYPNQKFTEDPTYCNYCNP